MLRISWGKNKKAKGSSSKEGDDLAAAGADDATTTIVLARVNSKEDLFSRPSSSSTAGLKKRTSSKEDLPDDEAPSMKRHNSKEDARKNVTVIPDNNTSSPSTKQMKKKSVVVLDLAGLEIVVADKAKMERALKTAKNAHCAEGLEFLQAVQEWEKLKEGAAKTRKLKDIVTKFIKEKSPREICLPTQLRADLVKQATAEDITEARKHVLNDIRFNERVMQALV